MNPNEILDKLYASYGTDSGILFGIADRMTVKIIVDLTFGYASQQVTAAISDYDELKKALRDLAYKYSQLAQAQPPQPKEGEQDEYLTKFGEYLLGRPVTADDIKSLKDHFEKEGKKI